MPRKLTADLSLDALEDEILYTASALEADPDTSDLASLTLDWLEKVDAVRARDRTCRQHVARVAAARIVANQRLDLECLAFSHDLLKAVHHNCDSSRWRQFFTMAPHQFIHIPLAEEVCAIRRWLTTAHDTVLEQHRPQLVAWSCAADLALAGTRGLVHLRTQLWLAREHLVRELSAAREALHALLARRAEERAMPPEWPDLFFAIDQIRPRCRAASSPPARSAIVHEVNAS